jgi:hypothetical protein
LLLAIGYTRSEPIRLFSLSSLISSDNQQRGDKSDGGCC